MSEITRKAQALANLLVDRLVELGDMVDPEYSESCLDSSLTNRRPATEAERLVFELHRMALAINASGLCDGVHTGEEFWPEDVRFVDYGA
jgi:hypothetical protein